MWFIQVILLCNVLVLVCAAVGKELSSGDAANLAPQSLPLTGVNSIPVFSDYWTSFLNISYVDTEQNVWHTEKTDTARYSTTGSVQDVEGLAVELLSADDTTPMEVSPGAPPPDNTGCTPPFKKNYPSDEPWIAVVRRGKCTFNQKITNALKLNASGVLVYDNENVSVLQSMKVEWFRIPSVFTYNWKGKEILELIRTYGKVYLGFSKGSHCRTETVTRISDDESGSDATGADELVSASTSPAGTSLTKILYCVPPDAWNGFQDILKKQSPFWNWNITGNIKNDAFNVEKKTSVLFVSVSFIVLMLISLAWLVFYYIQRFRYIHAKDRLERKLCSQAKRALAIISTSVLKKDDLEMKDFSETCAVCIENYRVADVVRILPCKHQFHKSCIDQWLLEKRTCPMCKMDILKYYGLVEETAPEEEAVLNLA